MTIFGRKLHGIPYLGRNFVSMDDCKIRVGVTQGDINGIGYEVILKTFSNSQVYEDQAVVIYGSSKVVAYHKKVLDLNGLSINTINRADEAPVGKTQSDQLYRRRSEG